MLDVRTVGFPNLGDTEADLKAPADVGRSKRQAEGEEAPADPPAEGGEEAAEGGEEGAAPAGDEAAE